MVNILNPWVILALILAFLGVGAGGYSKGKIFEHDRQQLEIAKLNQEARQKEQALVSAVNTIGIKLVKVNNDAKKETYKRDLAIASGALRLRIPVKASECPISAPTDTASAPRDSGQTTAELDPTIARSLVAITDQGDANTRQLNACIDAYNEVRNSLKATK